MSDAAMSARRGRREIAAVVGTGVGHFVWNNWLRAPVIFIVLACLGWGTYVVVRARRDEHALARWGLRGGDNRSATIACLVFFFVAAIAMATVGSTRGHLALHPHMLPLVLLYPIWGLVQQLMVQGLISANLAVDRHGRPRSQLVVTLVAASAFGVVHSPHVELCVATFLLGLFTTPVFLRWRSLWPLAALHGELGVLIYFWVFGRDAWIEIVR